MDAGLRQAAGVSKCSGVPTSERINQHCFTQQSVQCTLLVLDAIPLCLAPDHPHRIEQPGQQDIRVLATRRHRRFGQPDSEHARSARIPRLKRLGQSPVQTQAYSTRTSNHG